MTLFEGLIIANLFISLVIAFMQGKVFNDIETLYEGLALTMDKVGLVDDKLK